jgi:hypothetical protein
MLRSIMWGGVLHRALLRQGKPVASASISLWNVPPGNHTLRTARTTKEKKKKRIGGAFVRL